MILVGVSSGFWHVRAVVRCGYICYIKNECSIQSLFRDGSSILLGSNKMVSLDDVHKKGIEFWSWVEEYQEQFLELIEEDSEDISLLDEVERRLHDIDEDLSFEFNIDDEEKHILFELCAGGLVENIPVVEAFVGLFPNFAKWEVLPFRQACEVGEITVANKRYTADKIFFDLAEKKLTLYIKNFKNRDYEDYMQAGLIFLDCLLGEYLAMTGIDSIVCMPMEKKSESSKVLTELPLLFDSI